MRLSEIKRTYNPKLFTPELLAEIEKYSILIKKQCTQIVSIYQRHEDDYFYRGLMNSVEPFIFSQSKESRAPRNTPIEIQNRFDKILKKLGFTAIRSNSIFVTPDYHTARGVYATGGKGNVYVIFPVDGFSYTWSPNVHDFYVDGIDPYTKGYGYKVAGLPTVAQFMLNTANLGDLSWFKRFYGYTNKNLEQALNTQSEVLIHGKYYAVRSDIVTFGGLI